MDPDERTLRRLPLDGAVNVRELGGYPTANGGVTRFGRFLRADDLGRLSSFDVRYLRDYGVSAVVDLRDPSEVENMPDVPLGAGVAYANTPLLAFNAAQKAELEQQYQDGVGFSMFGIYRNILENYEGVRDCMRFIATAPEGCVLFHCAAGKDRTGILAMLLLILAGVDRYDVVADYVQSWPNLMRDEAFRADWRSSARTAFRDGMLSDPAFVEFAYDTMEDEYGGVESYLLGCGVPDEDVASVRQRLIG